MQSKVEVVVKHIKRNYNIHRCGLDCVSATKYCNLYLRVHQAGRQVQECKMLSYLLLYGSEGIKRKRYVFITSANISTNICLLEPALSENRPDPLSKFYLNLN